jgi:Tfp pilus assembly protein PilF
MRPEDIERLASEAGEALAANQYVRALALLDQLQAIDADNAVVHQLRANVLLAMGNNEAALIEAEHAARLAPTDKQAPLLVARTAWRMGATGKAQSAFERAIKLSSPEPALLAEYAVFMAWERGPRPAELAAREALAANEQSAEAWAALGLAQHRMHRASAADASLKRALQLDPNSSMAQSAMVIVLRDQHQDAKAAALVEIMQDEPANAGFVAAMRKDLRGRKAVKKLLERPEVQQQIFRDPTIAPRRTVAWLAILLAVGSTLGLGAYLSVVLHNVRPAALSVIIAFFAAVQVRHMFYAQR